MATVDEAKEPRATVASSSPSPPTDALVEKLVEADLAGESAEAVADELAQTALASGLHFDELAHRLFGDRPAQVEAIARAHALRVRASRLQGALIEAARQLGPRALATRLAELAVGACASARSAAVFLTTDHALELAGGVGFDEELARGLVVRLDGGALARAFDEGRTLRVTPGDELPPALVRGDARAGGWLVPLSDGDERVGVAWFPTDDSRAPLADRFLVEALCRCGGELLARARGRASPSPPVHDARAEAIFDAVPLGLVALDRDGRVQCANPAAQTLLGRGDDALVGRRLHDLVQHARRDGRPVDDRDCVTTKTLADGVARESAGELFVRADGHAFPVGCLVNALRDAGGICGAVVAFRDLTERHRADEALRRSEARFRTLVTALGELVWVTDPEGHAREDAPTWRAYTGQSFDDARDLGWLDAVHPDDRARLEADFEEAVRRGVMFQTDYRIRRRDGLYRWFFVRGAPAVGADGEVREWVGACIDVDDRCRRLAEQDRLLDELTRERRKLAAVLERIPVGVLIAEPPLGRVTMMNSALERIVGARPRLESVADYRALDARRPDGTLLAPDELPLAKALLVAERTTDEPLVVRRPDGREVALSVSALPLVDGEGRIESAVATFVDVTARRELEERSRLLDRLTRAISGTLEGPPAKERLLSVLVPDFVEAAALTVLGDRGEARETWSTASAPELEPVVRDLSKRSAPREKPPMPLSRLLQAGTALVVTRVGKDTLRSLTNERDARPPRELCSLAVLPLDAGERLLGVLALATARGHELSNADFTFARELARRLGVALDSARLYAAAQEAIRARDQLLSMASHDLKSPLTTLRMQAQMIQRQLKAGKDPSALLASTFERMTMMDRQLVRLAAMLDELLDVSRIQAGRIQLHDEPVDLSQLVRDTAERVAGVFEKEHAALSVDVEPGIHGEWDRLRLEQVVTNLLTNAAKYGAGRPVELRLAKEGDRAHLVVADHGIGISADDLARVFEPFERVSERHRQVPGTGLGLWIAKRIVQAMDGRIDVDSAEGRGSTFHVRLPIHPPPGDREDASAPTS